MKKMYISMLVIGMTVSSLSVFADTRDDVTIPYAPSVSAVYHVEERNDENRNERRFGAVSSSTVNTKAQARGTQLIKERINSLQANLITINASKTLTADQKTAFVTTVNNNINGLTTLQTSIASSTDATSTKALVNSIFTNYRIYGIVIPQIRLQKRINDLQNHSTKLADTFVKVQAKIDEAKTKGKDTTVWQKSLDDAKVLVASDMNTLSGLFTKASALKPVDYGTTSKMLIDSVNTDIKKVAKDFNSIAKNLHRPMFMKNLSRKVVGTGTVQASPLFGTSWTWVSATNDGTTTTPLTSKFVLSFGEDNHISSATDCNSLMGKYTLKDTAFSVGPLAMTMMFCDGSQEQVYAQLLGKVSSYAVAGDTLTLSFDKGQMVFKKK